MGDFVTAAVRSRWMAGIKGQHTQPELTVRRHLHAAGLRFRLHVSTLPGRPDVVLPRHRVCVFVNGCFWHHHQGCDYAPVPATRPDFWSAKLQRTRQRDEQVRNELQQLGWRVIDIWECGLRDIREPRLEWLAAEVRTGVEPRVVWPAVPVQRNGKRFMNRPRRQ